MRRGPLPTQPLPIALPPRDAGLVRSRGHCQSRPWAGAAPEPEGNGVSPNISRRQVRGDGRRSIARCMGYLDAGAWPGVASGGLSEMQWRSTDSSAFGGEGIRYCGERFSAFGETGQRWIARVIVWWRAPGWWSKGMTFRPCHGGGVARLSEASQWQRAHARIPHAPLALADETAGSASACDESARACTRASKAMADVHARALVAKVGEGPSKRWFCDTAALGWPARGSPGEGPQRVRERGRTPSAGMVARRNGGMALRPPRMRRAPVAGPRRIGQGRQPTCLW